jgi:hypothetical protein
MKGLKVEFNKRNKGTIIMDEPKRINLAEIIDIEGSKPKLGLVVGFYNQVINKL